MNTNVILQNPQTVFELNTAGVPRLFGLQMENFEDRKAELYGMDSMGELESLFRKDPFVKGQGSYKTRSEVDFDRFTHIQHEGAKSRTVKFGLGRVKNWTYRNFGSNYKATRQAIQDGRFSEIIDQVFNLSKLPLESKMKDMTHVLTFGFDSSYTDSDGEPVDMRGIDGLPLFHAAHTLPNSTATYNNIVTGNPEISRAAIITAEELANTEIKDGFGRPQSCVLNKIIIPNYAPNKHLLRELLGSNTRSDQPNPNVINTLSQYTVVALSGLNRDANWNLDSTKSKMWIIGAFGQSVSPQIYYSEHTPITVPAPIYDKETQAWTYLVHASWGLGIVSGRGMFGSKPA
jgi:hypothetical protein